MDCCFLSEIGAMALWVRHHPAKPIHVGTVKDHALRRVGDSQRLGLRTWEQPNRNRRGIDEVKFIELTGSPHSHYTDIPHKLLLQNDEFASIPWQQTGCGRHSEILLQKFVCRCKSCRPVKQIESSPNQRTRRSSGGAWGSNWSPRPRGCADPPASFVSCGNCPEKGTNVPSDETHPHDSSASSRTFPTIDLYGKGNLGVIWVNSSASMLFVV